MEIVEFIFVALDSCGCFLELAAIFADLGSAWYGVRTYKKRKSADVDHRPSWAPVVVLAVLALAITGLVVVRYFIPR